MREECGVFAIYSKPDSDVATQAFYALYSLQHRGQESCGIAVNDDGVISYHRDLGLVPDVFDSERLERLGRGNMALGHVQYSKKALRTRSNAQPLVVRHIKGPMALAYNGALTNGHELRRELEMNGAIFHSTGDVEVIGYVITRHRLKTPSIEKAVEAAMHEIKGAYSLVIMSPTKMIAARDPNGFRPLCIGELGGDYIFASETCALDSLGAKFIREIDPGEIVLIKDNKMTSIRTHCGKTSSLCLFEFVYIARPDSIISGQSVHQARRYAGELLSKESPVDADVVIGLPDSGLEAALGYAGASGIPYGVGFIKNRYVGRTFIQPTQSERERSVRIKINPVSDTVRGKRVIVVDDSIVRGTTTQRAVALLREAGAKEIHMRISSPPFIHPCFFGVDADSRESLIMHKNTLEETCSYIGADSLAFLSIDGVRSIAKGAACSFCDACFTGNYPIPVPDKKPENKFEKKLSEKISGGQLSIYG